MQIVGRITDWQLAARRPGYERWMRYNPVTDSVEIEERWLNERPLIQAAQERELAESMVKPDFKPICVVPNSERARAVREGWIDDDDAWKRWMNDSDNAYLRVTRGRV